jgi:hypothetical protein
MIVDFDKPIANFDFSVEDLSHEQKVFYDYWLELKRDRLMPMRADFNPMKHPRIAAFLSLEDVTYDPVRFQVRLVGGGTSSKRASKGEYLDEIPGTNYIVKMLKQMVERKAPYFYASKINWDERNFKNYSSLIVPFSDDGERVTLCMACHHTLGISKYSSL